ncbi:MAG: [protein-PII] uridylyltransferase, partial [Pseudomonadota bacterium]
VRIDQNPCALLALGGYGRKEQSLNSDIDILFLFEKAVPEETNALIQEIIYPLWDLGLEVGYATRTLKECLRLATSDFQVFTSLIDARFICGIASLYSELAEPVYNKVLYRNKRPYLDWLLDTSRERHKRFGDSTYLLEPNLKEGLGGLRDYHSMLWGARSQYNIHNIAEFESFGLLTLDEISTLKDSLSFIWTVRNWLHLITKRKCDQLYFPYQISLADSLQIKVSNGAQPVELFLETLHQHMECLKYEHQMFMHKIASLTKRKGNSEKKRIGPGIEVCRNALGFVSQKAIVDDPTLVLKIFEQSAYMGIPVNSESKRLARKVSNDIALTLLRSQSTVRLLEKILEVPIQPFSVLVDLLGTGILCAIIPEFKGIVHKIQYDEYHRYPVDKHSIQTVETLKQLRLPNERSNDTLSPKLMRELRKPTLLLWAALLHDIGKAVQDADHARHGADLAKQALQRLGIDQKSIEEILFLIKEHLLLAQTATRRDLGDEKVVLECARKIGNKERLRMLYLLTVADSMATGPKAWNDWVASLIKELFFKADHILQQKELVSITATAMIDDKKFFVLKRLSGYGDYTEKIFRQLSPRYLLATPVEDIVRHIELAKDIEQKGVVFDVDKKIGEDYRKLTIITKDFPGLFSRLSGVFALHGLDILSAQIYTWFNKIAVDVFNVKRPFDDIFENNIWQAAEIDVRLAIKGALQIKAALGKKFGAQKRVGRIVGKRPNRIVVDNNTSDFFTIIEVHTHDSPGLLYRLTDAIFQRNLNIWIAKIATKIDQVVDIFYVRDNYGQKVDQPDHIIGIENSILDVLAKAPRFH